MDGPLCFTGAHLFQAHGLRFVIFGEIVFLREETSEANAELTRVIFRVCVVRRKTKYNEIGNQKAINLNTSTHNPIITKGAGSQHQEF